MRDLASSAAFRILGAARSEHPGIVTRDSGVMTAYGMVLFGLDAEGVRHLLLPVGANFPEDRRGSGIHLIRMSLVVETGVRPFCDIICVEPEVADVYEVFVEEVLDQVAGSASPADVAGKLLQRWRRLLALATRDRLSSDALAGLVGEMLVLGDIARVRGALDVGWWTGPYKRTHDFELPGLAVEVKTTRSLERRVVQIHGLAQLEPPAGCQLVVAHVRLAQRRDGTLTLGSVISGLLDLGADRPALATALGHVGVTLEAGDYDDEKFELQDQRRYLVGDGFPRLTVPQLIGGRPAGVGAVTYEADLDGAPGLLDEDSFRRLIGAA